MRAGVVGLRAVHVEVAVLAEIHDIDFTSLDNVMLRSDVVICLAPLTTATRGMIGREQVEAMRPGTVFVNVSRGMVVQTGPLDSPHTDRRQFCPQRTTTQRVEEKRKRYA